MIVPIKNRPNCGPHALASIMEIAVSRVENAYAKRHHKGSNWKGRTNINNLVKLASAHFGTQLKEESAGGSLARFVKKTIIPNRRYLVRVGSHFVSIIDGKVIDQMGCDRLESLARKRVTHAFWIEG